MITMDYKTQMNERVKEYLSFHYNNDWNTLVDEIYYEDEAPSVDSIVESLYESEDFYNYIIDTDRTTTLKDVKENIKYLKYNLQDATKEMIDRAIELKDYDTVEYFIRQQLFADYVSDVLFKEISKIYRNSLKKTTVRESKNRSAWKYNNLLK